MEYMQPLTQDELRKKLERYIDAAETHVDSEVAYERVRGYDAYFGKPFGNEKPNRSQHISRDVFDAVESVKSVLLQTFNASESVVRFEPRDEEVLHHSQFTPFIHFDAQDQSRRVVVRSLLLCF